MPLLRPHTLDEALDMLARPRLVQLTAGGGPPAHPHPHALLMDTGRVLAMSGIRVAGGKIFIGSNSTWDVIQRSRVLRQGAACLIDACRRREEAHPGGALLHDLAGERISHDLLLALETLDARIEVAVRDESGATERMLLPAKGFLRTQNDFPQLPLGIHFPLTPTPSGSALYCEDDLGVLRPDAQCAAAVIAFSHKKGVIESARLYFCTPDIWPFTCPQATSALIGRKPDIEAIEAVVRLAQRDCPQPRASTPLYAVTLSSHLMRVTLDRAFARSLATPL